MENVKSIGLGFNPIQNEENMRTALAKKTI